MKVRHLAVAGGLVILGSVGTYFAACAWVRDRIEREGAQQGLDVTVGSVAVWPTEIIASDVTASVQGSHAIRMTAPRVRIALDALTPVSTRAEGATLSLEGDLDTVSKALASLGGTAGKSAPGSSATAAFSVEGALVWQSPLGAGTSARCGRVQVDQRGPAASVACGDLRLARGTSELGPWSLQARRDAATSSAELGFMPGRDATAKAAWAKDAASTETMTLTARRHSLAELGVPPALVVGSPIASSTKVDIAYASRSTASGRVSGSLEITIDRLALGGDFGVPASTKVAFEGDARGTVKIASSAAAISQLSGKLVGTLDVPTEKGSLAFDASVTSCAAAGRAFATETFGTLGTMLGGLSSALGGDAALAGSFSLHADVDIDLHAAQPLRVRTRTEGDCRLPLPF